MSTLENNTGKLNELKEKANSLPAYPPRKTSGKNCNSHKRRVKCCS